MKKWIVLLLALFSTHGNALERYVALKGGARTFTNSVTEDIYAGWNAGGGAEVGVSLNERFSLSLNYGYFHLTGESIIENAPPLNIAPLTHFTEISLHNLDLLVHAFFTPSTSYLRPHIGLGPRIFFISIWDDSPYVEQDRGTTAVGGVVTAGVRIGRERIYLDPFLEWGFLNRSFSRDGASVSYRARFDNIFLGLAVGYKF